MKQNSHNNFVDNTFKEIFLNNMLKNKKIFMCNNLTLAKKNKNLVFGM